MIWDGGAHKCLPCECQFSMKCRRVVGVCRGRIRHGGSIELPQRVVPQLVQHVRAFGQLALWACLPCYFLLSTDHRHQCKLRCTDSTEQRWHIKQVGSRVIKARARINRTGSAPTALEATESTALLARSSGPLSIALPCCGKDGSGKALAPCPRFEASLGSVVLKEVVTCNRQEVHLSPHSATRFLHGDVQAAVKKKCNAQGVQSYFRNTSQWSTISSPA